MFVWISLIASFWLDGVLSNFFPYMVGNLSPFTSFFTLISLIVIYPFFQKREKKYYLIVFFTGYLYDLFYTNLFFTHAIIFTFLAFILSWYYKKIEINMGTFFLLLILLLFLYQSFYAFLLFLFNIVPITISSVLYLFSSSLILNLFYGEALYLLANLSKRKRHVN